MSAWSDLPAEVRAARNERRREAHARNGVKVGTHSGRKTASVRDYLTRFPGAKLHEIMDACGVSQGLAQRTRDMMIAEGRVLPPRRRK